MVRAGARLENRPSDSNGWDSPAPARATALVGQGACAQTVPTPAAPQRSSGLPELLDQPDDDAGGAADVAVPVDVLVLRHLAHELGAVGAQAVEDVVDGVDRERDARDARG